MHRRGLIRISFESTWIFHRVTIAIAKDCKSARVGRVECFGRSSTCNVSRKCTLVVFQSYVRFAFAASMYAGNANAQRKLYAPSTKEQRTMISRIIKVFISQRVFCLGVVRLRVKYRCRSKCISSFVNVSSPKCDPSALQLKVS